MGEGVIRIYSESPYEHLNPDVEEFLASFKEMWSICKKFDLINPRKNNSLLSSVLLNFLSKSKDPFAAALQIMVSSGDFYSGKQNSLAMYVMEKFENWMKLREEIEIPTSLKQDAINLAVKQKNLDLIKLVVDAFRIKENKEILVETINQLSANKKYKEACQLANLLELHDSFGIEEFVVPLVFQDKYVIAAQFLESSRKHQEDLAVFLDNLIGKKSVMNEAQSIIASLNIHDARIKSLGYKPLSKLLSRMIKAFNIPPKTCPNLNQKRGKGILQFLMHKRYVEKSMGAESWAEMVLEAIGDDDSLQLPLIENLVFYGDLKEAVAWAEKFGTPKETWPVKLQKFSQREGNGKVGNSAEGFEEENWDAEAKPPLKFHELPLRESQVVVIERAEPFRIAVNELSVARIIGIDAEWKPSFGFNKCHLALIQIATHNVVYIFDVIMLRNVPQIPWETLESILFDNPKILKLGFGVSTDMIIVKETFQSLIGMETGSEVGFLDLATLWKTLVNNYKFTFPFSSTSKTSENLNCLIEMCLGESLDKSDQFSNWENRPLRRSQIKYAALDAYCLLEVYNVMMNESKSQNIPISEIIQEIVYGMGSKKTTTRDRKKKKGGKSGYRHHQPGNKNVKNG